MDGSTFIGESRSIIGMFQTTVGYSSSPTSSIGVDSTAQYAEAIISTLQPEVDRSTSTVQPDCTQFTFVVYVVVFGLMCTFGLVGNFLSLAVLGWERRDRGRVATFLLQTMAVVDNLFLLAAGVAQISMALKLHMLQDSSATASESVTIMNLSSSSHSSMSNYSMVVPDNASTVSAGCSDATCTSEYSQNAVNSQLVEHCVDYYGVTKGVATLGVTDVTPPADGGNVGSSFALFVVNISAYMAVIVFPLVHVTQMWTVWITVLVAFNRYVAICRPFQVSQVCTMKQTTRQIVALGVAIFVYCLPRFFEYRIEYEREPVSKKRGILSLDHIAPTRLNSTKLFCGAESRRAT